MPIALSTIPPVANILCLLAMYAIVIKNMSESFIPNCFKYLPIFSMAILSMLFSPFRGGDLLTLAYSLLQVLIWPLVVCVIIEKDDKHTAKVLLTIFLLCYIITSVTTIIGCDKFPQASRQLAAGAYDDPDVVDLYHSMNIGGFDFVYNLALQLPLYIAFLKLPDRNVAGRITSRRKKIILFLAFILFLWAIVSAEYTTALLFAIAGTILLILPLYKVSLKRMAGYFVILAVAFLLAKELIIANKNFIANIFGSEEMSVRISSLIDLMSGKKNGNDTDLISRNEFWEKSLQCFFNNPLFGTATNGGGHSYIFDNLADKGLCALIAMVIMYSSVRKKIISPLSHSMFYPYYVIVYIFNIVLGFLNPFNGLLIFTFVIPLHYCYFSQYERPSEHIASIAY